jgi:hypothetical protein
MKETKLNENKSKLATKLNLGHELRTTDSKTKLCKRPSEGCRLERVKKFCGFLCAIGRKQNEYKGTRVYLMGNLITDTT